MATRNLWLGLACTTLAGTIAAQDTDAQDPAKAASVDVKSRVARVLKGLEQAPSFHCKTKIKSKASPIMRQMGGGKSQTKRLAAVKEGATMCWSKEDGDEVLGRRGASWVMLDRDGDWVPCRRPEGNAWKGEFLADPAFLANRLLHLLDKTKWEAAGSKEIGEKAVRVYKCKIDLDEANHLVRTGAMPEGGGMAGAIGRMIVIGGGGGGMRMPEAERDFEIELFEDPATKMPVKIVARMFSEGGAMGGVRIALGGAGGGDDDDEDEDEDDEKKKPAYTLEHDLSKIGEAKATLLSKKARKVLGQ